MPQTDRSGNSDRSGGYRAITSTDQRPPSAQGSLGAGAAAPAAPERTSGCTPYLAGAGAFPERAAQTLLVGAFLTEYYRTVAEWADWATALVERWPDDGSPPQADPDAQRQVVERADWG